MVKLDPVKMEHNTGPSIKDSVLSITLDNNLPCTQLKSALSPLLQGLDPAFRFIDVRTEDLAQSYQCDYQCDCPKDTTNNGLSSLSRSKQICTDIEITRKDNPYGSRYGNDTVVSDSSELSDFSSSEKDVSMIKNGYNNKVNMSENDVLFSSETSTVNTDIGLSAPSLAVVLFLHEKGPTSSETVKLEFLKPPWRFHHKVELVNVKNGTKTSMGKQDFYQPGPDLPLWAVSSIHCGKEHLRFTIFTRNFKKLVDFYRLLSGSEADITRSNFCLFELKKSKDINVQLGIKHSVQIVPKPCPNVKLHFKFSGTFKYLEPLLPQKPQKLSKHTYLVTDPDGNELIVEEICPATTKPPKYNQRNFRNYVKTSVRTNKFQRPASKAFVGSRKPTKVANPIKRHSDRSSYDSGQHSSSFELSSATSETSESNFGDFKDAGKSCHSSDTMSVDGSLKSSGSRQLKPWECSLMETMSIFSLASDSSVINLDQLKEFQEPELPDHPEIPEMVQLVHKSAFVPVSASRHSNNIIKHTKL